MPSGSRSISVVTTTPYRSGISLATRKAAMARSGQSSAIRAPSGTWTARYGKSSTTPGGSEPYTSVQSCRMSERNPLSGSVVRSFLPPIRAADTPRMKIRTRIPPKMANAPISAALSPTMIMTMPTSSGTHRHPRASATGLSLLPGAVLGSAAAPSWLTEIFSRPPSVRFTMRRRTRTSLSFSELVLGSRANRRLHREQVRLGRSL